MAGSWMYLVGMTKIQNFNLNFNHVMIKIIYYYKYEIIR